MTESIDEEEKQTLFIGTHKNSMSAWYLTEDEKLNLQLVGAGQRNKYVWRILL